MNSTYVACLGLASLFALGCSNGKKGNDMGTGPDMAMCFMAPDDTSFAAMRTSCGFAAGATAADTLGITETLRARLPVKHVIVLMKENRSFDHLFGKLSTAATYKQPDAEPVPSTFTNPDANNMPVAPFHEPTTCVQYDPHHQWDDMHAQVDGGKMDGFVKNAQAHNDPAQGQPPTDGHFVMGYYDDTDLPFYYWLASTFALADHHFASVRSGTWANRDYLVAATSHGTKDTLTDPTLPTTVKLIFDELQAANVSWQVYTDDQAPLEYSVDWGMHKPWGKSADFFAALQNGTLPSVAFIDANTNLAIGQTQTDEHPTSDVQAGEAWTRDLVTKLIASPIWSSSVLFYTYDEAGGFADHVPPPNSACIPDSYAGDQDFTELGVRVPLVAISPFAKRHFVSHATHQHTSITRFIETVFGLPALTARDANSDALLDLFDFCNPQLSVDTPPAAGTGKCTM